MSNHIKSVCLVEKIDLEREMMNLNGLEGEVCVVHSKIVCF